MTFRTSLLPIVSQIRGTIPGGLDIRQYAVAVEVREWSGDRIGEGAATTTTTPIVEHGGNNPKVRWLNSEELATGGYEDGTIEIGPVTPEHAGGGTPLAKLLPTLDDTDTARLKITGPRYPDGVYCRVHRVTHDRPFRHMITATPIAEA